MIMQRQKAISAVIATIMLLMITVSLIGVFYVFSSTLATQTTSSGSEQASQLTAQLSMCMQVDNIVGNQVTLRNCGKGVIENKSLVVMIDDVALGASTQTILEGNSSAVNISGLWQIPFGKHSLKISNGAAVAQSLVEIIPNPDGLAGSWNFDEGSGSSAYDGSGNGNVGTLTNMNTSGNSTSGWNDGKFGSGLLFDGTNDYVDAGNGASLNITDAITVGAWINANNWTRNELILNNNLYQLYHRGDWAGDAIFFLYKTNNNIPSDSSWGGWEGVSSIVQLQKNGWYQIVSTKSGNKMNFYVNGIKTRELDITGAIINSSAVSNLKFGGNPYFNGTIDEVRVWNKAFSPDETVAMKQII